MRIVMRIKDEDGQAVILGAVAMGIFLVGAIGLAVDGAHMYAQRQMAQSAADAAATAGILTLFDGTNSAPGTGFTTSTFTCSTTDTRTPCAYASKNGFGGSATDTVVVDFPATSTVPGVNFSPATTDPTALIRVTVSRRVSTTLMALLGTTVSTVSASAMAGIVDVIAPVPILVTHPTLDGSLSMNGTPNITICGGPSRSIQVNSGNAGANAAVGNSTIDLSHAGPLDIHGDCTTGTGADFGYWGGPSSPPFTFNGGTLPGKYLHASPIQDPLAGVAAPPVPVAYTPTPSATPAAGVGLCPASAGPHGCTILTPGLYVGGLSLKNTTVLMQPGIYYMQGGGFGCLSNCNLGMVPAGDPLLVVDTSSVTGTGTGWDGTVLGGGVMIFNSGTGQINIGSNGNVDLIGSPASSPYKNILFFEDHTSGANTGKNAHSMGGGGNLSLKGTIYLTNTLATMQGNAATYQELDLQGNPGSATTIQGEIIVGALGLGGNGGITMNLNSSSTLLVRQVALVN
jgi:Flp pilus assembly protein TadG